MPAMNCEPIRPTRMIFMEGPERKATDEHGSTQIENKIAQDASGFLGALVVRIRVNPCSSVALMNTDQHR